jgi:hypothetical protein
MSFGEFDFMHLTLLFVTAHVLGRHPAIGAGGKLASLAAKLKIGQVVSILDVTVQNLGQSS